MIINDTELTKQLKAGICNPRELTRYLLDNYPATQLARELAETIIQSQAIKPIVITKETFEAHFRLQGYKIVNGELIPETRGRSRKEIE